MFYSHICMYPISSFLQNSFTKNFLNTFVQNGWCFAPTTCPSSNYACKNDFCWVENWKSLFPFDNVWKGKQFFSNITLMHHHILSTILRILCIFSNTDKIIDYFYISSQIIQASQIMKRILLKLVITLLCCINEGKNKYKKYLKVWYFYFQKKLKAKVWYFYFQKKN